MRWLDGITDSMDMAAHQASLSITNPQSLLKLMPIILVFPSLSEFPQLIVIHTVKGFGIVNKAEIDVFLKLSCFFDDSADVGHLISGSEVRGSG